MSKKIYLVKGDVGEYSDREIWVAFALSDKKQASDIVNYMNAIWGQLIKNYECWEREEADLFKKLKEIDPWIPEDMIYKEDGEVYEVEEIELRVFEKLIYLMGNGDKGNIQTGGE